MARRLTTHPFNLFWVLTKATRITAGAFRSDLLRCAVPGAVAVGLDALVINGTKADDEPVQLVLGVDEVDTDHCGCVQIGPTAMRSSRCGRSRSRCPGNQWHEG